MLSLLTLLLFSPFRCATFADSFQSRLLVPQSPRLISNRLEDFRSVTSDSCKGILPWTCVCSPEISDDLGGPGTLPVESVTCTNSRLTDTDVLLALQTLPNVQYATFYGNNFVEFPDRILGPGKHKSLLYFNLSNNNLLYLNQDAFVGVPSLQSLDLSENALYLRESTGDFAFLRPLRFLRRLLLRRAFRRPVVNASAQLALLDRGLRQARLRDLQFLDLSENDFEQFPRSLVCSTPSLTHLILSSNRLRTLHFDERCPIELKALDLRWNRIKYFDYEFSRAAQYFGPISVQVTDNPFDCSSSNCESMQSVSWFRSTNVIKDKETIRCRAGWAPEIDDEHYRPDHFLLYAPLRSTIHCKEQRSTSQELGTSLEPYSDETTESATVLDDKQLVVTLLSLSDNETSVNNSANALKPFQLVDLFNFLPPTIESYSGHLSPETVKLPGIHFITLSAISLTIYILISFFPLL